MNSSSVIDSVDTKCTLDEVSDELLVIMAKSGDRVAFVELWNRHSKRTFQTVCRITKNREDAEDVLQDTFLKAFAHLQNFDGRSKFCTWLTRIAINSALMTLRKKRTHPETSMDSSSDGQTWQQWEMEDRTIDIEGHYVRCERERHLRRAINRLRPALRDVVEIQQLHDSSLKEIAAIAGISIAAAKSRLSRARVALRRSLC